jgi:hypothetical protein
MTSRRASKKAEGCKPWKALRFPESPPFSWIVKLIPVLIVLAVPGLSACKRKAAAPSMESHVTEPPMKTTVSEIPPLPAYDELDFTTRGFRELPTHRVTVNWVNHGRIGVLIHFPKNRTTDVRDNYGALRERWPQFIDSAIAGIEALIVEYDHQEYAPDPATDCFEFEIPETPISEKAEWDFHINSEPAWVIDLIGWEIAGGQGVF